jgi:hypothetical protein
VRSLGSAEQILAVPNGGNGLYVGFCRKIWRRIKILQLKVLRLYPYYNPSWEIAAQCSIWRRMGDQYLRLLLVIVITSLVRQTKSHPERASKWLISLLERKPVGMATVAMAKKTARVVQAVLTRNEPYTSHTA